MPPALFFSQKGKEGDFVGLPDNQHSAFTLKPRLTIISSPDNGVGEKLEIQSGATALIGSGEQANLRLKVEEVLPLHCALSRLGDDCVLAQINPLASVVVNGAPVRWAELKDGDTIYLGRVEMIFRNAASDGKLPALVTETKPAGARQTDVPANHINDADDGNHSQSAITDDTERFRPANVLPTPEQKTEKRYLGKLITAKCDDCRAIFRDIPWMAGDTCPRCKSARFFPVVQVMADDAYEAADRSRGTASWDFRFLTAAKWCGVVREAEVARALKLQEKAVEKGWTVLPADRILANRRAITEQQATAIKEVLHFHSRRMGNVEKDEDDLAKLAVSAHNLEVRQVEFLKHAQIEMNSTEGGHVPLSFVMIEKGALPEKRALVLLHQQRKLQRGLLHDLHEALRLMNKGPGE